jgi:hypothetical protein
MDKQEAIHIITRGLENNISQEEIASVLSHRLGAPPELTKKFVAQVAADWKSADTSTAAASAGIESPNSVAPVDQAQPSPNPAERQDFASLHPDIPQTFQPDPQPAQAAYDRSPVIPAEPAPSVSEYSIPDISSRPKSQPVDPELEAEILKLLSKNKKRTDIAMMACEQTGMNWDQAQRLVARIESQNRKKLTSRHNRFLIPFTIIVLLAGVALLIAGASELLPIAREMADPQNDLVTDVMYTQGLIQEAFWALVMGLGLLLGGGVGLFKALQSQMD